MSDRKPDFSWQAEMGYTLHELTRGLCRAVEPYTIADMNTNPIEIIQDNRKVELHTGEAGHRAMGSIRIPFLPVRLDFFGFKETQYEDFLHRFRLYFQKGGG